MDIDVIPLGTVSPYPKNEANCPAFLVLSGNTKILLDIGNGSCRNLDFPNDLNGLNVIITHYHKDHYGDIGALQYASFVYHNLGLLDERVNVYLPKDEFCSSRASIIENKESFCNYIDINDTKIGDFDCLFHDSKSHTIPSYMVRLNSNGASIVYTSDIGMSNYSDLVEFCNGADLLICESSFLIKHNSSNKTHMRARDAATLARDSGSGKLLLTHFWPEEDKSLYLEEAREVFPNVDVAVEKEKIKVLKR